MAGVEGIRQSMTGNDVVSCGCVTNCNEVDYNNSYYL